MSEKTIGITGAGGFVGKHLVARVSREEGWNVVAAGRETFASDDALQAFASMCDVIVHLAGANRGDEDEIFQTNVSLAEKLVAACEAADAAPASIYASTTQADYNNPYGNSKRIAGETFAAWAEKCGAPHQTLVIPNVYGAGCKPFYNSVVATFCHQLTHGETPEIHQDKEVEFICVSELVEEIVRRIKDPLSTTGRQRIDGTARMTITDLLATLMSFQQAYFEKDVVPELSDTTSRNLYATFLSHIETDDLRHRPQLHTDDRGSLVEVIKLAQAGQVFFSTTKPGIVRGDHYHTRKIEWFCVLRGQATIRLRRVGGQEIKEFTVSGDKPEFISIPVMHTHNIENVGDEELLTMFWCNEIFDAADADTFYEKVA